MNRVWLSVVVLVSCKGSGDDHKPPPPSHGDEAKPVDAAVAATPVDAATVDSAATPEDKIAKRPACLLLPPPHGEPLGCPVHSCGNSAKIHGSIIEALDTEGKEVQDLVEKTFVLKRGTLVGASGGCAGVAALSLEVRDGGFIGVAGDGVGKTVKCSGNELVNASVKLIERDVKPPGETREVEIRIKSRGEIPTWRGTPATVPTYELVEAPKTPPVTTPLCGNAPWDSTLPTLPPRLAKWRQPSANALLVQGETYKKDATVGKTGDRWFDIGCAGSALAKMRLLGFDPAMTAATASTADQRVTTLKMITAKYCGADSWTRDGTRILMRDRNPMPPDLPGLGAGEKIGPIEARWGPTGALCVSHLRLWVDKSDCAKQSEPDMLAALREQCSNLPACDDTQPCATKTADGDAIWNTCTVNHIAH